MASINFVILQLDENTFSGGLLCIMEYARGLCVRGHKVNLIPLLPSQRPRWFLEDLKWLPEEHDRLEGGLVNLNGGTVPIQVQAAVSLIYTQRLLRKRLAPADVTIATACTTALPVHLYHCACTKLRKMPGSLSQAHLRP